MLEESGKLQGDSVRARKRRTDISVHKIFHAHRKKGGILSQSMSGVPIVCLHPALWSADYISTNMNAVICGQLNV